MVPEAEQEAEPRPPRRISDAPSARGLKPRHVSAVRRFPLGCGRFPSPTPPPPTPTPLSPPTPAETVSNPLSLPLSDTNENQLPSPPPLTRVAEADDSAIQNDLSSPDTDTSVVVEERTNGNGVLPETENVTDLSNRRWMHSKFYPPPKRRPVSAKRRYPPGCGRGPDFTFGSIQVDEIGSENDGVSDSDQNVVPVEEDENGISHSQSKGDVVEEVKEQIDTDDDDGDDDDSQLQSQELRRVEKEVFMEDSEIDEPDTGEDVRSGKSKADVVSMHETTLLNSDAIADDAMIDGLCEDAMMLKVKNSPLKISEFRKVNSNQAAMSSDGIQDAKVDQPSMEMVVFEESLQRTDQDGNSKGKEKMILKKKGVAKRSTGTKLGGRSDETMNSDKDTAIVPIQRYNDDYAAMDACDSRPTTPLQKCPSVSAKKSVAGPSRPRLSLTEGKTKKKGTRVAKKSIRSLKEDSPGAQLSNVMTLTLPPVTPSDGERLSCARGKVKRILRLFQMVCRVLLQKEESGGSSQGPQEERHPKSKGPKRIDLNASDIVKRSSEYVGPGNPVVGHVPGVEVGDEFCYRVELHLIGLHRHLQSGIDWTKINNVPVATSIVASGGYSDGRDGSDVLIYTGSGGQPTGKKGQKTLPQDQKLEKGNLALKNSMDMKTPVRVIHGLNMSETGRRVMTFIYDGLYMVEEFNKEPQNYKIDGKEYTAMVFKYKMRRMPGQPEVGLHIATKSKKSKVREGLCVADISQGKEKIPICAINTVDNEKPPEFKYITKTIYPSWYQKTLPKGCECTSRCSSSKRCACALKNGGELPFNFSGAIVQATTLIYECGPSCRCPPSCYNRVSQSGIRIPLEIFKTETRGWGVRSLSSIPSGSFVCEYVGELLQDEEAERKDNDEYLFDIGHNYDDAALWEGLPSFVPGMEPMAEKGSTSGASASEGFTIDAAEMGNVGRFINHSCSPNLYAQNVLFDHDDSRMPHVMFFAAENIPPLQELTYHYNYTIGQVRDSQGNEKVKECYCGSSERDRSRRRKVRGGWRSKKLEDIHERSCSNAVSFKNPIEGVSGEGFNNR
ncbi:hypothetical protein LUZ63_013707 [Rhynchospora breviuscula]|uniref:Histone-lysine N-methyltransferase n=1 Tax=Rhynchospora breviuscula TaxID=2022672 RepID=A0A9Q0C933_9POAL|nr:hypothetical protein LUZ63_013707 [Rhynchospora breviuscula]